MDQDDADKEGALPCSSKNKTHLDERELRKKAMKLDLAPILGKAFRYVTVNKNGECKEVDEQYVHERRESFLRGLSNGTMSKTMPMKKLRKARPSSSASNITSPEINIEENYTRPEWLPEAFTIIRATQTYISGWVNSEEELSQVLAHHSDAFSCKFISWYRGRGLNNTFDPKRIAWKREDIEPDCPFAIDSYLVRHCPYGLKLKRVEEVRESYGDSEKDEESKQSIVCHARLKIRRVTLYNDFKLSPDEKTKKIMWEKMITLKKLLNEDQSVNKSIRIYLQLPLPPAHKNHSVVDLRGGVKTESNCAGESDKEDEAINRVLMEEQGEVSFNASIPKLEIRDIDEVGKSMGDTFEIVSLPMEDGLSNSDPWNVEQSFIVNAVTNELISNGHQIKDDGMKGIKDIGEFQLAVRPLHKRTHILSSCKVDCPARIKVKRVSLYESFRLEQGDTRRKKDDKMIMVKDLISNGAGDLQATPAIFMQLPLAAAHRNHQVTLPLSENQLTPGVESRSVNFDGNYQKLHLSWLPQSFTVTSCGPEYLTGWVHTEEDYLQVMDSHRLAFNCSFLAWSNDKERTLKAEADRRVLWKKDFIDPGCPLTVHHSLILACAYSDQSKGKNHPSLEDSASQATDLACLVPDSARENIIQAPSALGQEATSLEIQYCDAAHQYPQLQSLIKPNETYIILVENS
ncbi:hypothetical protein PoB_006157400 [Plakobranchus ocellatus]|uniref:Uncharacterized protein n=1 Tax=Plakobranchus ocellatus TaxID=259542 RepID=A0AAV4CT75_9GAST|nr:hypothetical protein PoB_006157400 [Plakobranchus ocellatus]